MKSRDNILVIVAVSVAFIAGWNTRKAVYSDRQNKTSTIDVSGSDRTTLRKPLIENRRSAATHDVTESHKPVAIDEILSAKQRIEVTNFVEEVNQSAWAQYQPFLSDIGLSDEAIKDVVGKLKKLHFSAIESGDARMALIKQRLEYDSTIKALTGEKYDDYRAFEKSRRIKQESQAIQEFASTEGIQKPIDASILKTVANVITSSEAYEPSSWHEPYDPLPNPLSGAIMLVPELQRQIRNIQSIKTKVSTFLESEANGAEGELAIRYLNAKEADLQNGLDIITGKTPPPQPPGRAK